MMTSRIRWLCRLVPIAVATAADAALPVSRHPVPREHPYLLGSLAELRALAQQRPTDFQRVRAVTRNAGADTTAWLMSAALVAAIDGDPALARKVQERAMKFVRGPIRRGHVTFATDLALCGIAYDLCPGAWSDEDRRALCAYVNQTVDANVQSETHVFHNGWYGYKNWGIGVAGYATFHENDRSPVILQSLETDFRTRAAPALALAGAGGGWAEGYYVHYWLYEWLFFCEVARRCEGLDYYALAPEFFRQRAVASMFETFPGIGEYHSRRNAPMGDGGGRTFGGDRDKSLSARRILVNYFRADSAHQAVHAFNETTPRTGVGNNAYLDFLWHDPTVTRGDLAAFSRSHVSPGPGYVQARSSWDDDATYFFFKCGDRFTAHQHLDVNHFVIYKHAELAGDGGHYDEFGSSHDVNYHLRSIAHNTLLVLDPAERWPGIRAGQVTGNDGGQHHAWAHHNGGVADAAEWQRQRAACDIADLLACEDHGDWLHVAGDATRAYSPAKLAHFTRQIVYLRPDTFVIFDRVKAREPGFKKTWLLQAMRTPTRSADHLVITHGRGRLFVQTLLPVRPAVRLVAGDDLYRYGGHAYPPKRDTGPAPECRIEISPPEPAAEDFFLHVLTAGDDQTASAPPASVTEDGPRIRVTVGETQLTFRADQVGGAITLRGRTTPLAISAPPLPAAVPDSR